MDRYGTPQGRTYSYEITLRDGTVSEGTMQRKDDGMVRYTTMAIRNRDPQIARIRVWDDAGYLVVERPERGAS